MSPLSASLRSALPQTSETLVVLLASVAKGDRDAFAVLYQATCLKLYGVAIRILRRPALAEDVLQDVYVKIWERAADFNSSRGSAIGWMAAIVRNRSLDEVRRGSHLVSTEDTPGIEDIADGQISAFDKIKQSEDAQRLKHCLDRLEENKRQMILLAYHYGLSREALALKFDHPAATIKTWLRRSLESLKECLAS